MVIGFADGAVLPSGNYPTQIEFACRVASLAIEQFNLIGELKFQARHDRGRKSKSCTLVSRY